MGSSDEVMHHAEMEYPVTAPSATKPPLKVGLFGIGLDAYWPQFAGLERRLKGYLAKVERRLARPGVEVVNLGLIDNPP